VLVRADVVQRFAVTVRQLESMTCSCQARGIGSIHGQRRGAVG